MIKISTLFLSFVAGTSALELLDETWDEAVKGKSVFVAFKHTKCEHCLELQPEWEKLYEDFENHADGVVAEVLCMQDVKKGTELCPRYKIGDLPDIRYGDPTFLQKYTGPKDYESLKAFAQANLKPSCGLDSLEYCDEETKDFFEKHLAMDFKDLEKSMEAQEEKKGEIMDWFIEHYRRLYGVGNDLLNTKNNQQTLAKMNMKFLKQIKAFKLEKEEEAHDEL